MKKSVDTLKIAIIGAGNMGSAIARGIASMGREDLSLTVANPSENALEVLKADFPQITITSDNIAAAAAADIVILAVKPKVLPLVIEQIMTAGIPKDTTIVSIAGGVGLDKIEQLIAPFDVQPSLFHVIPDTAISVGRGMTFISCRRADEVTVEIVKDIFASVGIAEIVDESLMGAATALSSCGIAYVYKFAQAMVQAGVEMGFRPAEALRYVAATIDGAAAMLSLPGATTQSEIDRVTTPGGLTIRGINELDRKGMTAAVIDAVLKGLA